jgi:putative transposase
VRKIYQNEDIDTNQPTVPEAVSVALTELAGEVQEGLLALAVGTGLQVLTALMEQDVTAQCGVIPEAAELVKAGLWSL